MRRHELEVKACMVGLIVTTVTYVAFILFITN
jgi:hypothetical protein